MKFAQLLALLLAVSAALLNACATPQNDNFNSALWVQTASEYRANSIQTFNGAARVIGLALSDPSWTAAPEQSGEYSTLPEAVVMDIDETVLDNSKYQAQLVKDGAEYSSATWDRWISLKDAAAVPGAVDFINTVRGKNVQVIFITNRECKRRKDASTECPQEQDTIDNLARVGVGSVKGKDILLKRERPDWSSEK